jgi:hypothetical protein
MLIGKEGEERALIGEKVEVAAREKYDMASSMR